MWAILKQWSQRKASEREPGEQGGDGGSGMVVAVRRVGGGRKQNSGREPTGYVIASG